jgi:acetyl esterase/lipase
MKPPLGRPMFDIPEADVSFVKRKHLDLPYAALSPSQKLDVYLPDEGDGPFPVLFVIHGGGFEFGDKRDEHVLPFLLGLKHNYAVVSANYRLSHQAIFPAAVQDLKAAVRWIRANADKYHFDGSRIAACGGSAGGNLAAMLGVTGNIKDFNDPALGSNEFSSNVQAVVDWFGPMDFLTMDEQHALNGKRHVDENFRPDPESRYIGAPIHTVPEKTKKANPATYIHPGIPPFFIQHGNQDENVPYQQSVEFAVEIKRKAPGTFIQFELLEKAGHGDPKFETAENMEKVFSFLAKHLIA